MRTIEQFYLDLDFFRHANYTQKLDFMRKNWGNVLYDMVIFYTDNHSVNISVDSNKKYTFTFNIANIMFDEIEKYMPKYSELIENGYIDELKKFDKNLEEISYSPIENIQKSTEQIKETEISQDVNNIVSEYINLYKNISINKK